MILGKFDVNSSVLLLSCNSGNVMRDNLLVNFGGHPMPIDLNIKHLIGILKVFDLSLFSNLKYIILTSGKFLFCSKGIYSTWERLGNISAIVDLLQSVKKEVTNALGCSYLGMVTFGSEPWFEPEPSRT